VAGSRAARERVGHGLQLRPVWRLESPRRVRAVPVAEVQVVPVVARRVAAGAADGREDEMFIVQRSIASCHLRMRLRRSIS
jgi:hypothetical protein